MVVVVVVVVAVVVVFVVVVVVVVAVLDVVAPSCGFSDNWGCLGRLGYMFAILWVVLTTVVTLFASFWRFGGHFGGLSPHVGGLGTLWVSFGHPGCRFWLHLGALGVLFGVIWDLLGPLWAPLGRPRAARGGKVDLQAGEPEKWTILGSHFGKVLGGQNCPKK